MNWLIFFIGVLVGWLIEWLIDVFYWRRRRGASVQTALVSARDGSVFETETRDLTAQLERCRQEIGAAETEKRELLSQLERCRQDADAVASERHELTARVEHFRQHVAELEARPASAPARPDNLTSIEGIGPKIAEILQGNGVSSFAQLAETSVETLRGWLQTSSDRFRLSDPHSWPEQAALAARGEWQQLEELQNRLKGGRRSPPR